MLFSFMKNLGAEFFDIFGVFVFVFIIAASLFALQNKGKLPEWVLFIFLSIGIVGFFVDIFNVYTNYFQ